MLTNEQAELVANAVLGVPRERQHERARQREEAARLQHAQRRRGVAFLAAITVGGLLAYMASGHAVMGMLAGGGLAQILALALEARRKPPAPADGA